MEKLINVTLLSSKWAHFKWDACSEKSQLGEYLATNSVNWHQVCIMISYKRDVLERQSLSEVKMGRGKLWKSALKIVETFTNNVPQCQIAKAL